VAFLRQVPKTGAAFGGCQFETSNGTSPGVSFSLR
jgi:hypothetical protein